MDYEFHKDNPYQREVWRAANDWLRSYNKHLRYSIHLNDEALSCLECSGALRYYDEQLHLALNWEADNEKNSST